MSWSLGRARGVGYGRSVWRWFRLSQCWFALVVGFLPSRSVFFALVVGSSRRVRWYLSPALLVGVGFGPSPFSLVLVVLRVRWFRIFFCVRCRVLARQGRNFVICGVSYPCLTRAPRIPAVKSGRMVVLEGPNFSPAVRHGRGAS